ncbi:MAG TPA: patatin-like phospholipase family protein [Pseudoxanthomonas sp.]|nr:patatin-like phospholipase family protein [Pseudoxanthomonas sp.]
MANPKNQRSPRADTGAAPGVVLALQGGAALGAYQAGVLHGLDEAGIVPRWIAGISIGAIHAALIAGNPPQRRMQALQEFWDTIVQPNLPLPTTPQDAGLDRMHGGMRRWVDAWEVSRSLLEGQRGFFHPRPWLGPLIAPQGSPAAASLYDTAPLRQTLERLVDFERLNDGGIRVSMGAVDVESGQMVYFDTERMRLDARHVMASGAYPPSFPAVEIDGRWYWDGTVASNCPLSYVLEAEPRRDALAFQVELWSAAGRAPCDLNDVMERQKDILHAAPEAELLRAAREHRSRRLLHGLLEAPPPALRDEDARFRAAEALASDARYSVVRLVYRQSEHFSHFKSHQFGGAAIREHRETGLADIRRALAQPQWLRLPDGEEGFVVHRL